MNIDLNIQWWFKDIPYFWESDSKKFSYNRVYIIPTRKISEFVKFKESIEKLKCNTEDKTYILNYFQFTDSLEHILRYPIKVNGKIVYKPKQYSGSTVNILYEDLKLSDKIDSYAFTYDNLYSVNYLKSKNIDSHIKCGSNILKKHLISELVCLNLNSKDMTSFLNGKKMCTDVGKIITNNLIRVASQRMYTDSFRSLIEPVSNSIDSYREMRGESSIGKFGMGFFSLLWWLNKPNDNLVIKSTYFNDTTKSICTWKCVISLYQDSYGFDFSSNEVSKSSEQPKTGTTITLNIFDLPYEKIMITNADAFKRTFFSVKDALITHRSLKAGKPNILIINPNYDKQYEKNIISIDYSYKENKVSRKLRLYDCIFSFQDYAKGISIETLFSKMLVPSISTKTLETFTSKEIVRSNNTNVYVYGGHSFYAIICLNICVGDISVYSEYELLDHHMKEKNKNIMYVLGLPAQTPLPVSRDDVILTDPIFYNIAKEELFKLIDEIIIKNKHIDFLFILLKKYAEYAKDFLIYQLIEEGYSYISSKKNVILVPIKTETYYNTYIKPYFKDYLFLESSRVNYDHLSLFITTKMKSIKSTINNRTLILIKKQPDVYTEGGLYNVLFLNEEFVKSNPENWEQKLKLQLKIETFEKGFESLPKTTINIFLFYKNAYMVLNNTLTDANLSLVKNYDNHMIINRISSERYNKFKSGVIIPSSTVKEASDLVYSNVKLFYDIISPIYFDNTDKLYLDHYTKNFIAIKHGSPLYAGNTAIIESDYNKKIIFEYLFNTISSSYVLSNRDEEFMGKFSKILYVFLLKFPYRKIDGHGGENNFYYFSKYFYAKSRKFNYYSNSFQIEDNLLITSKLFYTLDTEKQKESYINFIAFFFNQYLSSTKSDCFMKNPLKLFFMQRLTYIYDDIQERSVSKVEQRQEIINVYHVKIRDDIGLFNKNFILDKHYVYWIYLDVFSAKYFMKDKNIPLIKFQKCMEFIYGELRNKYNFEFLEKYVSYYIKQNNMGWRISMFDLIIKDLINMASVYESVTKYDIHTYNIKNIDTPIKVSFDAIQLLNYVYEYEVDMNSTEWFKNVGEFTPSHEAKFQALEIVINEGTSKSFADSVLTEMIQNSIDASRNETNFICKSNDKYFRYKSTNLEPLPEQNESVRNCPGISIECGEITNLKNSKGLSVIDFVGISTKGIVSLLVPFLSTKTTKDELSTGEMGTGFMNVYRQPYTKKVIIQTRNPDDHLIYTIEAIPILSHNKKRVVNLKYVVSKTLKPYDDFFRHTCITILFNDNLTKDELSSLMIDVELYSNKVLPAICPSNILNRKYNNYIIKQSLKLLYEDPNFGKIYSCSQKIPSYVLTNGVPFGDLSSYIFKMGEYNGFWVYQYSLSQIIVDLNKNVYQPVQSRKRIIIDPKLKFEDFIKNGIFEYIIENIDLQELYDLGYLECASYEGNPVDCMPSSQDFSSFFNFRATNMGNECFAKWIQLIIYKINLTGNIPNNTSYKLLFEKNLGEIDLKEKYLRILRLWFDNKKYFIIKSTITSNDKIKEDQIPEYVLFFIRDITTQLWKCAQRHVREKLIEGLNEHHINKPPVKIEYGDISFARGYYDPKDHKILFRITEISSLEDFKEDVKSILKEKDTSKIIQKLKFSKGFCEFMGTFKQQPTLFVHEMCHAFLEQGCQGENVHGDFSIKTRATSTSDFVKHDYTFYQGAKELFLLFLQDYKPYWLK